jgi:hypothetical protein
MAGGSRGGPWRRVAAVCLVLGGLSFPVDGAPTAAVEPSISFFDQAVVASGVTPGGKLVWLGVMRELKQGALDWSHVEKVVLDTSGTGSVRLELGKAVPPQSIWLAVDLATGRLAAGAPPGYPLRRFELPGDALRAAAGRVEIGRRLVILLWVRPGVGVWALRVGDGGPGDADGVADGTVRVAVGQLVAVDAPGALEAVAARDVVIVVDQDSMELGTVTLK